MLSCNLVVEKYQDIIVEYATTTVREIASVVASVVYLKDEIIE